MQSCIRVILVLTVLALLSRPSVAQEKNYHALVLGNSEYTAGALKNPVNDALLMESTLKKLGFKVTQKSNLDQQGMEEAIQSFCSSLPKGSLAMFFFAGHGVQVKGQNYLIPVDAKLESEASVKYKTVAQNFVLDALYDAQSSLNVIVLDCCRDNPFERSWKRSANSTGLAGIDTRSIPQGTFIGYATSAGQTASDGKGANSPYTQALSEAISKKPKNGLKMRDVFYSASKAVYRQTGQEPDLFFKPFQDEFYIVQPAPETVLAFPNNFPNKSVEPKIESKVAASTKPPTKTPKAASALPSNAANTSKPPRSTAGQALLKQANSFFSESRYDLAINAYTALINDHQIDDALRVQSRKARGATYLARSHENDISLAIVDYLAAGEKGIRLSVQTSSAKVQVGKTTKLTLQKNQSVRITRQKEKWLWVDSPLGDPSLSGWVTKTSFQNKAAKLATTEPKKTKSVKSTVSQPKTFQPKTSQPTNSSPAFESVNNSNFSTYKEPTSQPYIPPNGSSGLNPTNSNISTNNVSNYSKPGYSNSIPGNQPAVYKGSASNGFYDSQGRLISMPENTSGSGITNSTRNGTVDSRYLQPQPSTMIQRDQFGQPITTNRSARSSSPSSSLQDQRYPSQGQTIGSPPYSNQSLSHQQFPSGQQVRSQQFVNGQQVRNGQTIINGRTGRTTQGMTYQNGNQQRFVQQGNGQPGMIRQQGSVNQFGQPSSSQSQFMNNSNSGQFGQPQPSGANNSFYQNFIQQNGRPPSVWQTPQWENAADRRRLRQQGLIK